MNLILGKEFQPNLRMIAAVLVVLTLLLLTCHMMLETAKFNDNQIRLMVTTVYERINANRKEDPIPITPSVEVRAEKTFRSYPRTMATLILAYLLVILWNQKTNANLHTYLSAVFLLAGIGCSYKFLFGGFYGLTGESGFLVMGLAAGVLGYLVWNIMEHRIGPKMFIVLCLTVLGLLVWVLFFGEEINGNKGWIRIAGILVQPSEFIKCILIMLGASSMNNRKRSFVYSVLCLLTCACLVLCKDLGAACVTLALFLMMTYIIFDKKRYALLLIVLGLVVLYFVSKNTQYVQDRLDGYLHAMNHPKGSTQQRDFIVAVIQGGWRGLGVRNATTFTKLTAAGTDASLAGILCVMGLPTLLVVMGCYFVIFLCFAQNSGVSITCHPILFQLALVIYVQVILNFCGSMDVLPFTGVTSPLLSTGGSATVTMCGMFGVAAAAMTPRVKNRSIKKEV